MARKGLASISFIRIVNKTVQFIIEKFTLILLLIILSLLVMLQKTENRTYLFVRSAMVDSAAPVIAKIGYGFNYLFDIKSVAVNLINVYKENEDLRARLDKMQIYPQLYEKIDSENKELKRLLNYTEKKPEHFLTARILINSNSPFSKTVVLSAGSNQGIYKGQVVVNDKGIIGRVIEVNNKTSRVLLIFDYNSRVSVVSAKTREKAIAGGNSSNTLDLMYLRENNKLEEGEMLISSGDGELIPYGLPIGIVEKDAQNKYLIKPFVNIDEVEYVSVIDSE